ncbi:MAG TPA: hypothetical protein VM187_12865 [Niastella sp.]|nr:hypothetical protein [Niastella sp.]
MNKHYYIVLAAFLIAQALMASIMVYNYQKDKNIPYGQALYAYLKAEVGFFIIGFIGILGVCFLLSDFIDLSLSKADLASKEQKNWKVLLQLYFKTCSFVVGGFIQYIAFIYKKKGKIAIDKAADKLVP